MLVAHFDRPKGVRRYPEMSLEKIVEPLSVMLGQPVRFVEDCIGEPVRKALDAASKGDVLLLENVDSAPELARLCDKVVSCIRPPFHVADELLRVTTSAGVAVYRGEGETAAAVLALADGALYEAKKRGRDRFVAV